jgi:RNA polymerase sigma factor (sigma-70 family)
MDPDDLLQEICLRALASFESFDPDMGTFRAWVFGVANHTAKDAFRRVARRGTKLGHQLDGTSVMGKLPDTATAVSQRVAREESMALFLDEARNLSKEDQSLLM